jgi:hypothetical protein
LDALIEQLEAGRVTHKQALMHAHIPKGYTGQITWNEVDRAVFLRKQVVVQQDSINTADPTDERCRPNLNARQPAPPQAPCRVPSKVP